MGERMIWDTGDASQTTVVMGIVNVTPDSFSDGGRYERADAAVEHGLALVAHGAHLVDVGGESTRPGAAPVTADEEMARVLPVVRTLAAEGVRVSIDTRNASTAERAVDCGAVVINDVTGFGDPAMRAVAAAAGVSVVVNHMPTDDPRTMQAHARYDDIVAEVRAFFVRRIAECREAGITDIVVDPGIGFGKTTAHNLVLLDQLHRYADLGCPVLIGASRKRFIGELAGDVPPTERVPGSVAAALAAVDRGARVVRVHDVAEHVQALRLWHAIRAPASNF
jgi:dihydropteroate synthase